VKVGVGSGVGVLVAVGSGKGVLVGVGSGVEVRVAGARGVGDGVRVAVAVGFDVLVAVGSGSGVPVAVGATSATTTLGAVGSTVNTGFTSSSLTSMDEASAPGKGVFVDVRAGTSAAIAVSFSLGIGVFVAWSIGVFVAVGASAPAEAACGPSPLATVGRWHARPKRTTSKNIAITGIFFWLKCNVGSPCLQSWPRVDLAIAHTYWDNFGKRVNQLQGFDFAYS